MTQSRKSAAGTLRQESVAAVVLVLACLAIMLPSLSYPLIEPDETRYAQIAMEMNDSGDWITPRLAGKPYLDKPPLMYWLTATSFSIFATNEIAARLPSVVAAIATILLTFLLGSRLVGSRGAWLGAVSLLLCGGFILAGRFLILDSLLTVCTTLSLLTGYIAVRQQHHRWAWWMLSGVACAFGALTKGPIALVLCAPPLIASGWLRRDQTRTRLLHWIAFVIPMVLVCVPWYIAVWKFNPEFGDYFFWEHNIKLFVEGSNHREPFWFYLPTLFAGMFPTSLLLPTLGVFLLSRAERKRHLRSKDLGFLFCGSVWILLFFSLSGCKLPTYILPAIPLICLMMGGMLDRTVFKPEYASRITSYLKPFPQRATLILVVACLVFVGFDIYLAGTVEPATVAAIVCCLAVTAITLIAWNREIAFSPPGWAFTALVAVALLGFAGGHCMPTIATSRSVYTKAADLSARQPDDLVNFYGEQPHGVRLHLPTAKVIYFPRQQRDEFVRFVASHQSLIVVASDEDFYATRQAIAETHELLPTGDHEHLYLARRITDVASKRDPKEGILR